MVLLLQSMTSPKKLREVCLSVRRTSAHASSHADWRVEMMSSPPPVMADRTDCPSSSENAWRIRMNEGDDFSSHQKRPIQVLSRILLQDLLSAGQRVPAARSRMREDVSVPMRRPREVFPSSLVQQQQPLPPQTDSPPSSPVRRRRSACMMATAIAARCDAAVPPPPSPPPPPPSTRAPTFSGAKEKRGRMALAHLHLGARLRRGRRRRRRRAPPPLPPAKSPGDRRRRQAALAPGSSVRQSVRRQSAASTASLRPTSTLRGLETHHQAHHTATSGAACSA
jgi:hypothetical protein